MYKRILVAIDATHPEAVIKALERTSQIGLLTHGTVYVLHVARSHIVPGDITAGAGLGVRSADDDVELEVENLKAVQDLVDRLADAGVDAHGEIASATEHNIASVILHRARELEVDLLEYQHHREEGYVFRHSVAEQIIHQHPPISILLARPPTSS